MATVGEAIMKKEKLEAIFKNLQSLEKFFELNPDADIKLQQDANITKFLSVHKTIQEARMRFADDIYELNEKINNSELKED